MGFRPKFEALLDESNVELVFPTVDAVAAEFATWSDARFVVSSASTARLLASKRRTYQRLEGVVPLAAFGPELPLPLFAKPDQGAGARGSFTVATEADRQMALGRNLLLQELLPGEEHTVDCLSDPKGNLVFASARSRDVVGRGIALATTVVDRPDLLDIVGRIAAELLIRGPWFAQFKADASGAPRLLEVNGRVAGSMTLTRLSGVNIPLISVFLFKGLPVRIPRQLQVGPLVRHLHNLGDVSDFDWVIWDLDDTLLRKDRKPDPELVSRLYDFHNQGCRQVLLSRSIDFEGGQMAAQLPPVFAAVRHVEDKPQALGELLTEFAIEPERCVMVNDSMTENLAIQDRHPGLRTLLPDAVDILARERLR